ncbi:MAG TPA: M23 family metallopeptidase [Vicinamibacterales bacterium]|jgi:murein DD-endopeptidase MepM/ murein hydrolase activator NlpD|nr:M23 family metallopeptidase [Vicinamibacterales bacterium]
MASKRYTIIIADRSSGVVRRLTLSLRPLFIGAGVVASLPVLIGIGAAWKAKTDIADLRASHYALEAENANFRSATSELATQVASLEAAIQDISARSALDPNLAKTMDKLPAVVKSRAMGGSTEADRTAQRTLSALGTPDDTFGLLRTLLEGLESRLNIVSRTVDRRNALAAATPSIWPAQGWLSSTMGHRVDPVTGGDDFHAGLDIAGERGQPVYATAAGTVVHSGWATGYGNLITINHGFGLETRYGHLLDYKVKAGQKVGRGDIIGHVGNTGRSTGYHLHYEVLANGKLLNPLQLLSQQKPRAQ